jgi:hypothetical protein
VANECIHGFEPGFCATCFPKAVPAVVTATIRAPRTKSAAVPRRSPGARAVSPRTSAPEPAIDVSEQRIYHLTHISNLAAILTAGQIFADANDAWEARPAVDISSAATREERRMITLSGVSEATVADFVPFFLSPNAGIWQRIRGHEVDPRLSGEVLQSEAADFVLLVSTMKHVLDVPFATTDGDATATLTRFATTLDDTERQLRRLRANPDQGPIEESELLVRDSFPFESVTLVGVAHDKARSAVRAILGNSAFAPKVAVYPPWFAAPES